MRRCILDGKKIENREMLHDTLAEELGLPAWYGRNLDALYDCLTDLQEETMILLRNPELLEDHLGRYAFSLQQVIRKASEENAGIHAGGSD